MFLKLIQHLRCMSSYSQTLHHLAKGSLFFQDHEALGDFYGELVGEFDRSAEKYVSLYDKYDFNALIAYCASKKLPAEFKENKDMFLVLMNMEKELCTLVDTLVRSGGYSEGCKNLLSDIGTKSEARQYKIKRRVM